MITQLTTSRLSLASTASTNLATLISKLESLVSEIPPTISKPVHAAEEESEDEDPTELFHRDIGVQTSLPSSRIPSRPTSPAPSVLNTQVSRLASLKSELSTLLSESTSEGQEGADLSTTVGVFREYLDGLAYVVPTYGYGGVGSYGGKEPDDEIGRVKASIRGVKGVLLSARSFPGGARAGR